MVSFIYSDRFFPPSPVFSLFDDFSTQNEIFSSLSQKQAEDDHKPMAESE